MRGTEYLGESPELPGSQTADRRTAPMPASEAQILANRRNASLSTGPVTQEGKERSRANAYKHGLTGAGTVLPEREAAEVERRAVAFQAELQAPGEVGQALVRRAAVLSVRMERCVEHENVVLTERVRLAEAEFVAPEGVDPAEAARLRTMAGKRAMFDPSQEATLARQYEMAAERGFFRALKSCASSKGMTGRSERSPSRRWPGRIWLRFPGGEARRRVRRPVPRRGPAAPPKSLRAGRLGRQSGTPGEG